MFLLYINENEIRHLHDRFCENQPLPLTSSYSKIIIIRTVLWLENCQERNVWIFTSKAEAVLGFTSD